MSDLKASLGECTEKLVLSSMHMMCESQYCSRSGYRLGKTGTKHDYIKVIVRVHYTSSDLKGTERC